MPSTINRNPTEEEVQEMVKITHHQYKDEGDLGLREIREYYDNNWGCGLIVGVYMEYDGTREIEFEDGTVYTDEVTHACYEHRRRW